MLKYNGFFRKLDIKIKMNIRGVRELENIGNPMVGTSREEVESDRVGFPKISRFSKESGFLKKSRFPKISRTRLPFLELLYNAV